MIISVDGEQKCLTNSTLLYEKAFKNQTVGKLLKLIKKIYKTPVANIIFNDEKLNIFILK